MSDPDLPGLPPELPPPPASPPAERFPFWGYLDLCMFIGLAVASLIAGMLAVKGLLLVFRIQVHNEVLQLLPAQFLGYLFLFLMVCLMFRVQYGRPFWPSMGWVEPPLGTGAIVAYGVLLAFAVGVTSILLKTPQTETPMSKLLH